MPPTTNPSDELIKLLQENLAIAKDTNRILRDMRRNGWIGLGVKTLVWLILLGVPVFFLSTYIGPLMESVSGKTGSSSLFGFPSAEQLDQIIKEYQEISQ